MLDELQREKYLDQDVAVAEIERRFGGEFVYVNQSGGQSINREVLGVFRKLTENTVVWVRAEKTWRFREAYDLGRHPKPAIGRHLKTGHRG